MIRGILEEPEQPGDPEGLVGMIGSLEYAIHSDRLAAAWNYRGPGLLFLLAWHHF